MQKEVRKGNRALGKDKEYFRKEKKQKVYLLKQKDEKYKKIFELKEKEFQSSFPDEKIWKTDYKVVTNKEIFGNHKIITHRRFRPQIAVSMGYHSKILQIPLEEVEKSLRIIGNSGENKEKLRFFEKFDWYKDQTYN